MSGRQWTDICTWVTKDDIESLWNTGTLIKPLLSNEQIKAQEALYMNEKDEKLAKYLDKRGNPVKPSEQRSIQVG